MRCTACATPLVKQREFGDGWPPEVLLFYTCETPGCEREGDHFGPAEEDGPSETRSFYPSDGGRAAMKYAGRAVR